MRAAIWLRVSTDMQVEGDSPLHHEKRARSYAEGKDWEVIEVYRLDAVSGKSVVDHPETKRMIADIKRGHVKALIFSKLARLARNTRELLSFSDLFQECGANLVSLGESIDTSSPAGRLYFTLIAALTQWEREEIAARVAASVPVRAKLGKSLGGAAPYGYKWVEGSLVPDEGEAPIRKLIYELWIETRRKKAVARTLNERGYRTRNGALWSDTTIVRLLQDQTAKGVRLANYTSTKDAKKAWTLKPESDWVRLPCEPIISEELWQTANDLLAPKKPRSLGRPAIHLFAGIASCHCGGRMYVKSSTPTKYRCKECSNRIGVSDLEELYHGELASFFVDEAEVSERMQSMDKQLIEKMALLASCESELGKLQKEIDKLYELYQSGMIDKYGFGEKYKPLSIRIEALNDEIPSLQGQIDASRISHISREEIMRGAKDLYTSWPSLKASEKREVIETITDGIIIGSDEITISLLHTSSLKPGLKATREHGFMAATSWKRAG
jgi:site-specific DNA recombinase